MAREIKFRAKSLDGILEYGDLHLRCNHPHIHNLIGAKIYIDTNTIGQFTGLHDKNGKEIYEGDILRIKEPSGHSSYSLVSFCNKGYYSIEHGINERVIAGFVNNTIMEVIGNIHDNPELLKGGKL